MITIAEKIPVACQDLRSLVRSLPNFANLSMSLVFSDIEVVFLVKQLLYSKS